jgi:hypothetical protein
VRAKAKLSLFAIAILAFLGPRSAQAQAQPPAQTQAQEPAQAETGVARVSFIRNDVSMQRGDSGDTSAVTLNTPLVVGDKISTGDASRTEVQLDFANIIRLDQRAQMNIANLAANQIQVQVGQGLVNYTVLRGSEGNAEIDTPNVAIHPLREGRYRIDVKPDGDTEVTVREGEAEVSTSQGNTTVKKGQLITIRGTGDDVQYKVSDALAADEWDRWNNDRDDTVRNAHSWDKTNRYYTGAGDLDPYGVWSEVPDYGPVWTPRVAVGWAPYRAGRWVWEPYYGWTWVSYEPWGWAPYHYGRWFVYGGSWAWWPGPISPAYRPVWAPAYVSFLGFGGGVGVGVGIGFGSIGWLPIGPGDYFHPWWGGYRDRFAVVSVTNIYNIHDGIRPLHAGEQFSNVRNVLVNDRLRQGVSGMPAESFGRGGITPRGFRAEELQQARVMTGNLPVVPTRENLRVSDRAVSPAMAARSAEQQRFFSRAAPAARPEPFSAQASRVNQAIERDGRFQAINASRSSNGVAPPNRSFGAANGAGAPAANQPQSQLRRGQSNEGQFPRSEPQGQAAQGQNGNGSSRFGARGNPSGEASAPPAANQGLASRNESRPANTGSGPSQPEGNQGQQPGWQRFSRSGPAGAAPRGNSGSRSNDISSQPISRPPLEMNKPIVNQRSYRGYGETPSPAYRGGSAPAPASPSYRTAPSERPSSPGGASSGSRGVPQGGSRGPSGGGGSRSGGGGGHGGSSRSGGSHSNR